MKIYSPWVWVAISVVLLGITCLSLVVGYMNPDNRTVYDRQKAEVSRFMPPNAYDLVDLGSGWWLYSTDIDGKKHRFKIKHSAKGHREFLAVTEVFGE